jgi:hypothetical protein
MYEKYKKKYNGKKERTEDIHNRKQEQMGRQKETKEGTTKESRTERNKEETEKNGRLKKKIGAGDEKHEKIKVEVKNDNNREKSWNPRK